MTDLLSPDGDILDPYRGFIAKSRYSRWLENEKRRETWTETVDRYLNSMLRHLDENFDHIPDARLIEDVRAAILQHEVMPSMRALMTAGEALDRSPIAGFNCSYLPLADAESLDELLYILMNGTGVGFSIEKKYVDQLPPVPATIDRPYAQYIHVADSKEGWAYAFRALLKALWRGQQPEWDMRDVRPAGARLRTFGGRASGPEPLNELFEYTVELFKSAVGRKFRPIEIHDLACKIASVVVVGGVRRSAMISLSDLDDDEMAVAKSGNWYDTHPHRALANISAVHHDGTSRDEFDTEWANLVASGSGERGIFHRDAARRQAAKNGLREPSVEYGTNPCSEIVLRPYSFCNLSEVVVRAEDTYTTLKRKVRIAAILGTWQSTLTDFPYLRPIWRNNAVEERLLGVSLTGIYDNPILNGSIGQPLVNLEQILASLRDEVCVTNMHLADELGITASVATTCVKPSGTVSQLVDSASGLHQRHAKYYVRRVRIDQKDPLAALMIESGMPYEKDVYNTAAWVFSFPMAAPDGAIVRADVSAIEHLELWLTYQRFWCEHKPSVTISVRPEEWDAVQAWVWEHLDEVAGVSFLPFEDHTYEQAPYEECTQEAYEELLKRMPRLQWSDLVFYETEDGTVGSQSLACSADGGGCEAVDLVAA